MILQYILASPTTHKRLRNGAQKFTINAPPLTLATTKTSVCNSSTAANYNVKHN